MVEDEAMKKRFKVGKHSQCFIHLSSKSRVCTLVNRIRSLPLLITLVDSND